MIIANEVPMSVNGIRLKSLIEYEEAIINAEESARTFQSNEVDEEAIKIKRNRHKGALYSAASKNCKREIIICWLHNIVFDKKIDITTSLAREILQKSINKSININELNDYFGTPGRTGTSKTEDFKKIDKIVAEIKSDNLDKDLNKTIKSVIQEMKSIALVIKKSGGSEVVYSRANEEEDDSNYGGL